MGGQEASLSRVMVKSWFDLANCKDVGCEIGGDKKLKAPLWNDYSSLRGGSTMDFQIPISNIKNVDDSERDIKCDLLDD
jgi:hypothetical protein